MTTALTKVGFHIHQTNVVSNDHYAPSSVLKSQPPYFFCSVFLQNFSQNSPTMRSSSDIAARLLGWNENIHFFTNFFYTLKTVALGDPKDA